MCTVSVWHWIHFTLKYKFLILNVTWAIFPFLIRHGWVELERQTFAARILLLILFQGDLSPHSTELSAEKTSLLNSAIFLFKLQQEYSGPPLYLCLIDQGLVWAWCRYSEFCQFCPCQGAATRCHRGADQSEWKCVGVFVVCLFTTWELFISWAPGEKQNATLVFPYSFHLEAEAFFLKHAWVQIGW